jgi:hypothetical protein
VAHIVESDVQAWLEESKLTIGTLDVTLEQQIATEVLGRLVTAAYDVTGWTDPTNTPKLVKKIIAMFYAGWFYDKMYSETADTNQYAQRLKRAAETLLQGIIAGMTDIEEVPGLTQLGNPVFFPTDASSALHYDEYDVGDGPAAFGMGARF